LVLIGYIYIYIYIASMRIGIENTPFCMGCLVCGCCLHIYAACSL